LLESFLLTEELGGFIDLRQFLRRRFPPRPLHHIARRDHDLDRLIRQVAQIARRFHNAGYNHRDFYCCHFFVKEERRGEFQIRVIDLQRVQRRRWFRRRWLVKDLAQLAWSLPRDRIQCTHRLAFMRHYFGVEKLRPSHKRLIRGVLLKQQVMERRVGIES
jgi:heptose I phosphotransferase